MRFFKARSTNTRRQRKKKLRNKFLHPTNVTDQYILNIMGICTSELAKSESSSFHRAGSGAGAPGQQLRPTKTTWPIVPNLNSSKYQGSGTPKPIVLKAAGENEASQQKAKAHQDESEKESYHTSDDSDETQKVRLTPSEQRHLQEEKKELEKELERRAIEEHEERKKRKKKKRKQQETGRESPTECCNYWKQKNKESPCQIWHKPQVNCSNSTEAADPFQILCPSCRTDIPNNNMAEINTTSVPLVVYNKAFLNQSNDGRPEQSKGIVYTSLFEQNAWDMKLMGRNQGCDQDMALASAQPQPAAFPSNKSGPPGMAPNVPSYGMGLSSIPRSQYESQNMTLTPTYTAETTDMNISSTFSVNPNRNIGAQVYDAPAPLASKILMPRIVKCSKMTSEQSCQTTLKDISQVPPSGRSTMNEDRNREGDSSLNSAELTQSLRNTSSRGTTQNACAQTDLEGAGDTEERYSCYLVCKSKDNNDNRYRQSVLAQQETYDRLMEQLPALIYGKGGQITCTSTPTPVYPIESSFAQGQWTNQNPMVLSGKMQDRHPVAQQDQVVQTQASCSQGMNIIDFDGRSRCDERDSMTQSEQSSGPEARVKAKRSIDGQNTQYFGVDQSFRTLQTGGSKRWMRDVDSSRCQDMSSADYFTIKEPQPLTLVSGANDGQRWTFPCNVDAIDNMLEMRQSMGSDLKPTAACTSDLKPGEKTYFLCVPIQGAAPPKRGGHDTSHDIGKHLHFEPDCISTANKHRPTTGCQLSCQSASSKETWTKEIAKDLLWPWTSKSKNLKVQIQPVSGIHRRTMSQRPRSPVERLKERIRYRSRC